jgi:hypothetical protein
MAGYTYEYDYAGWTSTGIMGISTKVSGGSIKGRLTIEPVDESTIIVAVSYQQNSYYRLKESSVN